MTSDSELLRQYAEAHSEEAFAQLVRRHLGLVYSAALRQVNGDAHLAQDVTQTVFTDLARKADALARRHALAGWLYTSTHFAAATALRTERRRRTHEQEAHAMRELLHSPAADFDWERLCPVLDEAMHDLKQSGINLGQTLANPDARCNLAQYDVGMQIQQQFLSLMDPNSPLGNSSQTAKDQLAEISQRLAQFKELSGRQNTLLPALSDEDLANYADHIKVFGGLQALKWLVDKYPTQY